MKWLHRNNDQHAPAAATHDAPVCEHVVLVPMWDRAGDIGHEADVSRYRCEACRAMFNPREALHLRATEAARVKRRVGA